MKQYPDHAPWLAQFKQAMAQQLVVLKAVRTLLFCLCPFAVERRCPLGSRCCLPALPFACALPCCVMRCAPPYAGPACVCASCRSHLRCVATPPGAHLCRCLISLEQGLDAFVSKCDKTLLPLHTHLSKTYQQMSQDLKSLLDQ